jgi:hypothetical protein
MGNPKKKKKWSNAKEMGRGGGGMVEDDEQQDHVTLDGDGWDGSASEKEGEESEPQRPGSQRGSRCRNHSAVSRCSLVPDRRRRLWIIFLSLLLPWSSRQHFVRSFEGRKLRLFLSGCTVVARAFVLLLLQ